MLNQGITLLGLGPGGPELLTRQAWQTLEEAGEVYLRTRQHPVVAGLPEGLQVRSFDALYEAGENFEAVYDAIVEQVVICSPDKDLAQLVSGDRVVCWDRRREIIYDEEAVVEKYGVSPASIPDYLALVGDSADGIPGIPAWGAKSVATVLSKFPHIEDIPEEIEEYGMTAGRARRLAENLKANREQAFLYRQLTTLRLDVPIKECLDDLEWRGARGEFKTLCQGLGAENLIDQVPRWISES